MIVLTLRTDQPEVEIGLYHDKQQLSYHTWSAHRLLAETLHTEILNLLTKHKLQWQKIEGIVVFKGPGSFTGLRIGASVANAVAYSQAIPVVGTTGTDWISDGLEKLLAGKNDTQVIPAYGQAPHITQQKK